MAQFRRSPTASRGIRFSSFIVSVLLFSLGTSFVGLRVLLQQSTPADKAEAPSCTGRWRSIEDVGRCSIRDLGPSCSTLKTWNDVERCLNRRFEPLGNYTEVHVLGERHSGTKFVMRELQQCFPKQARIRVHRDLWRSKHFFQPVVPKDFSKSLVVTIVRNPVDWTAAMRVKPYHSPSHIAGFNGSDIMPLPWRDFVTKPWTTPRSLYEKDLIRTGRIASKHCREGFAFDEVAPCRYNNATPPLIPPSRYRGMEPIYELDRGGQPFDSVLELRSAKILNHLLQVPLQLRIGANMAVRYEDLLEQGMGPLIERVAELTGVAPQCKPTGPQRDRLENARPVDPEFRSWIEGHMDKRMERLVGYA